jgi:hypothetical protein
MFCLSGLARYQIGDCVLSGRWHWNQTKSNYQQSEKRERAGRGVLSRHGVLLECLVIPYSLNPKAREARMQQRLDKLFHGSTLENQRTGEARSSTR